MALAAGQVLRVCATRLQPPLRRPALLSLPHVRAMTKVPVHRTAREGPQPETLFRPNAGELPEELPFPEIEKPQYEPGKEVPQMPTPPEPENPMPPTPPNHPKEDPKGPEPEIPIPRRSSPAADPIRMPPEFTPPSVPEYPGRSSEPTPEVSPGYSPIPETSPQYPNRSGASSPDRERQEQETPCGPIA